MSADPRPPSSVLLDLHGHFGPYGGMFVPEMGKDSIIVMNLSGRGDKDVASAARHVVGEDLKF